MANARISNFNGQNGGIYIADTDPHTGHFQAIAANSAMRI